MLESQAEPNFLKKRRLLFKCNFCIFNFDSRAQRNEHIKGHFGWKCCTVCDNSLILIGDIWYEIRPHIHKNCIPNTVETVNAVDYSSIETEGIFSVHEENDIIVELKIDPDEPDEGIHTSAQHEIISSERNSDERKIDANKTIENASNAIHVVSTNNEIATDSDTTVDNDESILQSRKVECKFCHKHLSSNAGVYKRHLQKMHNWTPTYECKICKVELNNKDDYKKHVSDVHNGRGVICNICNKSYTSNDSLRTHMIVHAAGKHICTICKKFYKTKEYLKIHMKNHELKNSETNKSVQIEKFKCQECNKEYKRRALLSRHIDFIHKGMKAFKCEVCGKYYPSKGNLKTHMAIHSDFRPFICNYCAKGFLSKTNLNEHLHSHTGEKPYPCDICQKKFSRKMLLIQHKRIHTREKIFKCKVGDCDRAFMNGIDAVRHRFSAHRVYTKKHICEICSAVFPEKLKLRKHMEKH